ncbi:hypothetical protein HOK51_03690 [Candidatus Woesearchaeota archaeon]|nr:hypothetical protein [Candidatus Woesearchaeota archaeon]MBT6518924.1 hypothetical protein [Candidatus Woesearchaeota archaeon]MBT7367592.1 hypothetical protein [Candidatus Woesearchaeota archaeon]
MKNKKLNLEKRIGDKLKNTLSVGKKYATLALTGIALVAGGIYVGGCGELSECCKEKECNWGCTDHYDDTCACDPYSPPDPDPSFMTQEYGLSMDDMFDTFDDD